MRTYALVGKSGTGKSYQCLALAREHKIDSIIDDGLLISGNRILAGKSAKHETNKISSVKRAIFAYDEHTEEVTQALENHNPDSILILGTSDRMVEKIAGRLGLPPFEKIFYIEDISSPEEIEIATNMRNRQGKHIIPAPVPEVKKQFSGYFLKSLIIHGKKGQCIEDTIIRPTYSYLGKFRIAPRVISDICRLELKKIPEITNISKIISIPDSNGYIDISIDISLEYPCDIPLTSQKIQTLLSDAIEGSTSIIAKNVNINIKSLSV
ncbi:MAG: hypothetical protein E7412_00335 [Ruminococcaceae bacterium]|nr:hypothetical protein [Oscillospiraceae bacterium]